MRRGAEEIGRRGEREKGRMGAEEKRGGDLNSEFGIRNSELPPSHTTISVSFQLPLPLSPFPLPPVSHAPFPLTPLSPFSLSSSFQIYRLTQSDSPHPEQAHA